MTLNELADILFAGLCDDIDNSADPPWTYWDGGRYSRFDCERIGATLTITDHVVGKVYKLTLEDGGVTESVDYVYNSDTGVWYSREWPSRAVKECLAGWACYQSCGVIGDAEHIGRHKGVTDQLGAYQWLKGETPHKFYTVDFGDESVQVPSSCD